MGVERIGARVIVDLSDTMIDLLGTLPSNILIVYAWTRLLRMRSNALFWVVELVFVAVVVAGRNEVGSEARFLFLVVGYGLMPFVLSVDRPLRKLLVIALTNVIVIVAELVSIAGWYLMTGLDIVDYEAVRSHAGAFVLTHVVHLIVLVALFAAFHAALGRFDREHVQGSSGFVWFPIVQALMLSIALASGVYLHRGSDVLYFGTAALSLMCLVADFALLVSMNRFARKQREDQRAALLQRHLDACLAQCDSFVVEAEQTAQMRHDVRNQAHAAMALAERGDYALAREHISSFNSSYFPK